MWQKDLVFPVWVVALVLASAAPFIVRLIISQLERRVRERTSSVVVEIEAAKRKAARRDAAQRDP
jgi:hypothetical protein